MLVGSVLGSPTHPSRTCLLVGLWVLTMPLHTPQDEMYAHPVTRGRGDWSIGQHAHQFLRVTVASQ